MLGLRQAGSHLGFFRCWHPRLKSRCLGHHPKVHQKSSWDLWAGVGNRFSRFLVCRDFWGDYFVFRMDLVKCIGLKNSICVHVHTSTQIICISHVRGTLRYYRYDMSQIKDNNVSISIYPYLHVYAEPSFLSTQPPKNQDLQNGQWPTWWFIRGSPWGFLNKK